MLQADMIRVAFELWGILFCLIAAICVYMVTEKKQGKRIWLTWLYVTQALLLLCNAMIWLYEGTTGTRSFYLVRIGYNGCYILYNVMILLCTGYLKSCIRTNAKRGCEEVLAYVLASAGIGFTVVSAFCGIAYYFDDANRYVRGSLYILPYVFTWGGTLANIRLLIKCRSFIEKNRQRALLIYLLTPFLAFALQVFVYPSSLLDILMTLSLIGLFVAVVYGQARELMEKEHQVNEMKIQSMMSQIQPHFLYNTLNAITYMCDKDAQIAKRALGDFSNFLRGNLNSLKSETMISFESELHHVEAFLALEKLRLGDELNIVYDINDSGFFLPPLTLQPIVENAVEHGIAKAECGGTLVIRTRREGDWHEILVADDGTGFDAQTYMSNNKHTHIGVENVHKRIWHQCGGTIVMSSSQGNGTQVIIRIPAK